MYINQLHVIINLHVPVHVIFSFDNSAFTTTYFDYTDSHAAYLWDYWPHDDGRSKCGYVGLTNLGATCYMATCMQHLYMIPQARQSVLQAKCSNSNRYKGTLMELQKMFAYLQVNSWHLFVWC